MVGTAVPYPTGSVIAVDVETDGLSPYHGHRLFCFAYISNEGEFGYFRKSPAALAWLKALLDDPTKTVVFHNAKFDLKMFWFEGIDIFNIRAHVDCTLILSKLFNINGNHDLRSLTIQYLGRNTDGKDEITEWLKKNRKAFVAEHGRPPNFSDVPDEIVKTRALWDVESTLMLHAFLKPRVMDSSPELYSTEQQLMFVVIDMENTGVRIDVTRAKELRAEAVKDIERIKKDLNRLICPLVITRVKRKKNKRTGEVDEKVYQETITDFNVNSTQIQMPAAWEKLGFELKFKTKPKKKAKSKGGGKTGGGRWAFDEYAMVRYVSQPLAAVIRDSSEDGWSGSKFYQAVHDVLKKHNLPERELVPPLILKMRELEKMVVTYYDHFIHDSIDHHVAPNGREYATLHCSFNQSEAMTGRFSSSSPNLQNIPRIMGPRECFVPRLGRRNWHLDYEQVEMKFFVHFAKDAKMAAAINDDIHLAVACEIYGKPKEQVTKEQRKRAKSTNFGIIYGSGPGTQAETLTKKGLPTTTAEATRIVANYHRRFPSVKRCTNDLKRDLIRNGYVVNPYGRRYHIPVKFGYKALNYMCQGTSADLMKQGLLKIWKWLRANGFRTRIIMTVHDEIVLEVPRVEEALVIGPAMKLMEDRESFYVPITVDAECNDRRWSNKKKPKEVGLNIAA